MYADDISQNHTISPLSKALNQDLESLDKWLNGNKISLNDFNYNFH